MNAPWIVYMLVVGTMLALCANALDAILRQGARATRWVWLGSLGLLVAFALYAPVAPSREHLIARTPATVVTGTLVPAPVGAPWSFMESVRSGRRMAGASLTASLTQLSRGIPNGLMTAFGYLWLVVTGLLLALIAIVHRRAEEAKRAWPRSELDGTRVRIAPTVGPAVIGLATPEIVLPSWILNRDRDEQHIVIAHESEHVAANDQFLPFAGWIVAAMVPWHPAVWWMLSRLRLAIELDCDARVLRRRDIPARSYGALLIDIAGQCTPFRPGALALTDGPSHLERRLLAMKKPSGRFAFTRSAMLGLAALATFAIACESRVPTSAQIESMDAVSAEKMARAGKLIDAQGESPTWLLDGKEVTEKAASAVPASEIASIEVIKTPRNQVHVRTKSGGELFESRTAAGALLKSGADSVTVVMGGRSGALVATRVQGELKEKKEFNGLVYINGRLVESASMDRLNRDDIQSVEVIKGAAAAAISSDPRAANGIIRVTLKR